MSRSRVDTLLVERGLVESRAKAQALIMAGLVYSDTLRIDKAGQMLAADAPLALKGQDHPWVSRGGLKLVEGLDRFGIDPAGMICLDVGASTGGFTDVLLSRGAAKVYAVDVGHGQLAWKLRQDPRVVVLERTNARHLTAAEIPDPIDLVVCDASFISLMTVLPGRLGADASGRASGGTDQAAVRGRQGQGRQGRRGARPGTPQGSLRDRFGLAGRIGGMEPARHRRKPYPGAGRQSRVFDRWGEKPSIGGAGGGAG